MCALLVGCTHQATFQIIISMLNFVISSQGKLHPLYFIYGNLCSLTLDAYVDVISYPMTDHITRLVWKVRQLYMNAKLHSFYTSLLVKIAWLPHFSFDNPSHLVFTAVYKPVSSKLKHQFLPSSIRVCIPSFKFLPRCYVGLLLDW